MLGRGVADGPGMVAADTGQACGRTDQHDRPPVALVDHRRNRRLDGVIHTGQVDVDDVVPTVGRGHRGNAGVGHHDVHPAQLVEAGLQGSAQRHRVTHIGLLGHDARTGVFDQLDRGRQVLGVRERIGHAVDLLAQIDSNDVGSIGGQAQGVGAALAAGRAGDQRDLALQASARRPRCHGRNWPLLGSPAGTGASILMSGAPARCSVRLPNS